MFRHELPRVYELRDEMRDAELPRSYLKNLDISLAEVHGKLRYFRALESTLGNLDNSAWRHLKSEVAPLLIAQDQYRGWQSLFDILNHAKAYGYLKRAGCTNIRFVAPTQKRGGRIADLEAERKSTLVLCEVKTINASQDEVIRRRSGDVGSVGVQLSSMFFSKLAHDLAQAGQQLRAQADDRPAELIVYVVINFDDYFHEYVDRYTQQIEAFLALNPSPDMQVVLDIKEAFGV
jgi:hypothetical protein